MGPLTPEMKTLAKERQSDIKYDIAWTTLGEYLEHLQSRGVSPNVASFVGATTVRVNVLGEVDKRSDPRAARADAGPRPHRRWRKARSASAASLIYAPATLRRDRRARRDLVRSRRECGGIVHRAHAQRRRSPARSGRRVDRYRASRADARRDLSPQGRGQIELAQDRPGDRARSTRRARKACTSPPTCTRTPRARPASTPRCRPGCRRAVTTPG